MTFENILAAVATGGLLIYLFWALFYAEKV